MDKLRAACRKLHEISGIPVSLVGGEGQMLASFPQMPGGWLRPEALEYVLTDFRLQKRDRMHPLISFLEPGYFLGVCQLQESVFSVIGLAGPTPHTRQEILAMCAEVIRPEALQQFCDMMIRMPTFSFEQIKSFLLLLTELACGETPRDEDIHFVDAFLNRSGPAFSLEQELFDARENRASHVSMKYETALCSAIQNGNRTELTRLFYHPVQGRIGTMSHDALRQAKYSSVSLATLVSRAAIAGGLPAEISFSMSDLFCQRVDLAKNFRAIQDLTVTTLYDYCDKVKEYQVRSSVSEIVQRCVEYISVHLHEKISLEDLSRHVGLCSRSLSLRFRQEIGMAIPDYIHEERILEAEYLLRHTDYSLSEISGFLNYPSQSYFTQIFKKHRAVTPQQFREGKTPRR